MERLDLIGHRPVYSAAPTTHNHDWQPRRRPAGRCRECGAPYYTMRRGTDFGLNRTCGPSCPTRQLRKEPV